MQNTLFNRSYSVQLDQRGLFGVIGLVSSWPVAAGAAGIKDETVLAGLQEGFTINAVVEVALVGWICVDAVGLASTETAPTRAAAPTATSLVRSFSDGRIGLRRRHAV